MNKKGIIALVVVVILVVIGFMAFGGDKTAVNNPTATSTDSTSGTNTNVPAGVTKDTYAPVTSTDTTLMGRLKKASVGVTEDGKKIALVDGKATFKVEGSADTITATLGNVAIEQTVGTRKDVIATVSVDYGARGTYTYVVLFEDKGGALSDKSYGELGADLSVTGLRADAVADSGSVEYVVSASYKTRTQSARSTFFVVESGVFNLAKTISL